MKVNVSKDFVTFWVDVESDSQVMVLQYWEEIIYFKGTFFCYSILALSPLAVQRFEEDALNYMFVEEDNGFTLEITYEVVSNILDKRCRIASYGKFTLLTFLYFFHFFIWHFFTLIVFFCFHVYCQVFLRMDKSEEQQA